MAQRETKQSNFFVCCGNDDEGTYLLLSWSSVVLSLVKAKQDHLWGNHAYLCIPGIFWSIYPLNKNNPKRPWASTQFLDKEARVFQYRTFVGVCCFLGKIDPKPTSQNVPLLWGGWGKEEVFAFRLPLYSDCLIFSLWLLAHNYDPVLLSLEFMAAFPLRAVGWRYFWLWAF